MAEYFFSGKTAEGDWLYLSPLSDRLLAIAGEETTDSGGHFLYRKPESGTLDDIIILAQVRTEDAVLNLRAILSLE
jgi:hypothetical protein